MSRHSVLVPNHNGVALLRRYLYDVTTIHLPVTVIDDASTDGSVAMLRREFPEVQVIERKENGGFSKAVNDGIRATGGEFVVLLNNDVEVTPGFLDSIMPLFEDESVFAASPRVLLPSRGDLDEGAKTGFWHHGMFGTSQQQGVTDVIPVLYATGAAAVYRRSMLEALGGFDEVYSPFYWEDADLGYRAWKRGWKSLYQPASTLYHQCSATISRINANLTNTIRIRNGLFFIWRNIEDRKLIGRHRFWLPLVLARRTLSLDRACIAGWRQAFPRRHEAVRARELDSTNRKLSDAEILSALGIAC